MDVKGYLDYMMESNHGPVLKAIDGVTEEESLERGRDNTNHIRWITGHLLGSTGMAVKLLKGQTSYPQEWNQLFIRGAEFSEDPSVYPSMEDLRVNLKQAYSELRAAVNKCEIEYLETEREIFPGWTTTPAKAVMFLLRHEFYHMGQIATLRRILGRERLFG